MVISHAPGSPEREGKASGTEAFVTAALVGALIARQAALDTNLSDEVQIFEETIHDLKSELEESGLDPQEELEKANRALANYLQDSK